MQFDIDYVRNQFPDLQKVPLRDLAFFDSAHASFPARQTLWRLNRYQRERRFDPGSGLRVGFDGAQEIVDARRRLAQTLNVREGTLFFGANTEANAHVIAAGLARDLWEGDEVIVADQTPLGIAGAFRDAAVSAGAQVIAWPVRPGSGSLAMEDLASRLGPRTRQVILPHGVPFTGQENDIPAIARAVRARGALLIVDGNEAVSLALPDLAPLQADVYLFSVDRVFGPRLGAVVMREGLTRVLPDPGGPARWGDWLHRLQPGGPDLAAVAAVAGISDYYDGMYRAHARAGRDAKGRMVELRRLFEAHLRSLFEPLQRWVSTTAPQRLLGPRLDQPRLPVVSFVPPLPAAEAAERLEARGIIVGHGTYGLDPLLAALGVAPERGVLRLSFQHYTTPRDVDRLVHGLDALIK